jgi:hypothetical protein
MISKTGLKSYGANSLLVKERIKVEYGTWVGLESGYLPCEFVKKLTLKLPGII